MNTSFDDYLGLLTQLFKDKRAVIFIGCSGAGKSSYIEFLLHHHPDFRHREVVRIEEGRPLSWGEKTPSSPALIVIDELLIWKDVWRVVTLARQGHRLLVASHLPRFWHWPLRTFGPMVLMRIDTVKSKMINELEKRQVAFSDNSVERFVHQFGASYSDLDMILEVSPAKNLDIALQHFNRFYSVEKVLNV